MKHCGTQKLETGRLVLRRLTMADADAMYRNWASDPEVTRFLTWPTHTDAEVTKRVIGTWLPLYEKTDYYHWAITLKENGDEPIGTIHGLVNDDLDQITVGYCLGRAWWHRGIMSETLQAVIDFFFDRVGPNSICSYHDPNNPHSGMVMKHCGMKYEGTRRASDRNNTGICDISWYSILRTEYRSKNGGGDPNMRTRRVIVLPYDGNWEQDFLKIRDEIRDAVGQQALSIEHVGSTSVRGLSAKPVIDIDVVIEDASALEPVIASLAKIGYRHEGDLGVPGREAFKYEGKDHVQKHHLYVCPKDSAELKRHIAFRDYLRSHPGAVREYSRVKEEGARLYPYDIEKYIEHKTPFIAGIYAEIGI